MHVLVAGATGNLGRALVRTLLDRGVTVTALARHPERLTEDRARLARVHRADVTRPDQVAGACAGVDVVVSAVGLVGTRALLSRQSHEDVDYRGNLNLLREAERANVPRFVFVSVHHAGADARVPLLEAKARFETTLAESHVEGLVVRPTGYFEEVRDGILAQARRGVVVLAGKGRARLAPVHVMDVAAWIADHLDAPPRVVPVGGPEAFTYDDLARLAFDVLGKRPRVVHVPLSALDALAAGARPFQGAAHGEIRFLRFALTRDLVAPAIGARSLREYLEEEEARA